MSRFVNPLKPRVGSGYSEALKRIRQWTLSSIPPGEPIISVTEAACAQPGCPPRETMVLILWPDAPTWKVRIHKAMPDVLEEDVVVALRSVEMIDTSR